MDVTDKYGSELHCWDRVKVKEPGHFDLWNKSFEGMIYAVNHVRSEVTVKDSDGQTFTVDSDDVELIFNYLR